MPAHCHAAGRHAEFDRLAGLELRRRVPRFKLQGVEPARNALGRPGIPGGLAEIGTRQNVATTAIAA